MKINHCKVELNNSLGFKLLIITSDKNITERDLLEVHDIMHKTTGFEYSIGLFKDLLGYYEGYDFTINKFIYCGTLNRTRALEKIKNYKLVKEI